MVNNNYVKMTMACALAVLTAVCAQIKFNLGPVPYTMQNFAIIISGLILGRFGAVSQLIYLAMIAVGLPVGAGFRGGLGELFGFTAGYLWMFPVSSFIMGVFRERIWTNGSGRELVLLWLCSVLAVLPLYALGFIVFYWFATGNSYLYSWCVRVASYFGLRLSKFWVILFSSVIIFIPQDIFMDHVLAVLVFKYVSEVLRQRGFELP